MKCLEREKLFAYRHQLLDGREEGAVRAHLADCGPCRAALDEYRRLDSVLEEWKAVEPRPGFDARLRAALEQSATAPPSSLRGLWGTIWGLGSLRWLAPALALAVVVVVSVVALRLRPPHPAPGSAVPQAAQPPMPSAGAGAPSEADAEEELRLYKNLPILEDYDMLADFDVLSELPKSAGERVDN